MNINNLNFKHLRYFWMVAKTGSIARASEELFLTPQSISGQISVLENSLNVELFQKSGRGLVLTEMGKKVFSYADTIFNISQELYEHTQNKSPNKISDFRIGVSDYIVKSIAYKVIEPVLQLNESIHLICKEGKLTSLLAELSIHELDLVIADRPMPAKLNVRAYNHLLGESKLAIFAAKSLLDQYQQISFPAILNDAPFLLQGEDFTFHTNLIAWFASSKIKPRIIGEFDDGSMLKSFGQSGAGFFAAPLVIADYICKHYQVEKVGNIEHVTEQIFAITTEKRLTHPAIIAIVESTACIFSS